MSDHAAWSTIIPSTHHNLQSSSKTVGAVVVGYNESNCREVYLSAKPSILHKALVALKIPVLAA
jgi:hypothetical protein